MFLLLQLTAHAQETKYTVSLGADPADKLSVYAYGTGTYDRRAEFAAGETVHLAGSLRSEYSFVSWTDENGAVVCDSLRYTFTMPAHDVSLLGHAEYDPENPPGPREDGYTDTWNRLYLRSQPEFGGAFTWGLNAEAGQNWVVWTGYEFTVTAYPATGFKFVGFQLDGEIVSTDNPYTFIMPERDMTLYAVYEYDPDAPPMPHGNLWDKESGELIMSEFTPGKLQDQINEVTRRDPWSSYWELIKNAIVDGPCLEEVDDWVTHNDWTAFGSAKNIEYLDYSRTSGLTYIPGYCFTDQEKLNTLVIPATTDSIGKYAFRGLKGLTNVTCFATTPPKFGGNIKGEPNYRENDWNDGNWAFDGLTTDNIIVHVPAESVPLYTQARGWQQFMVLPITQGVQKLTVSLPQAANYKDMFLVLVNTKTLQSLRYVITDATTYTFQNLIRDTQYNLYIKNQRDQVMGTVENIAIKTEDVEADFSELRPPHNVTLQLLLPDGTTVAEEDYAVTWTDRQGNYLQGGATLTGQVDGTQVRFRIKTSETLGRQYLAPADTLVTISSMSSIRLRLQPLPQITLKGVVTAATTESPVRNATVAVSQLLNGLYTATQSVRTDNDGAWTMTAYDAPTTITVTHNSYLKQTLKPDSLTTDVQPIALRDLTGTIVNLDMYYHSAVAEGAESESENFTGYDNVTYTVYDETHQQELTDMSVQYPLLVLVDHELDENTKLRITVTSLTNDFAPATTTCTVDSANHAFATIGLVEMGRLHATFNMTDNQKVMGVLYNANGLLVGWSPYNKTELTVNKLADGQYTLVTMGYNSLFTSVNSLAALTATGISEALMVKNVVDIKSGRIAEVNNQSIPTFSEDDFRLTGSGTAFTVNKSEVTVGQYVTLKAQVDFKAGLAVPANVQLLFDLPEGCEYVQQSMMAGNRVVTPQQNGQRLSIPVTDLSEAVRFCVVPTQSGIAEPVAYVSFVSDGQQTVQPIGSVAVTAESLTITVPETTGRRLLPVTGMAAPQSAIQVYDGDVLIGETTSLGTGYWSVMTELDRPYNLSEHTIYAIVTNSEGMQMQSESKTVTVNRGNLTPVVTMHLKGTSSEHHRRDFVFDFRTNEVNPKGMKLTDFGEFNLDFDVDFYDENDLLVNDTTVIRDVTLHLLFERGNIESHPINYNLRQKDWYLAIDRNYSNMPVNVDLDYTTVDPVAADRQMLDDLIAEAANYLEESRREMLDVYHAFDDEVVLEDQAERDELSQLLQVEEPDEAQVLRIDQLMHKFVGDSLMAAASNEFAIDFSEVDAIMSNPDLTVEQLEQASDLLDSIIGKWEAEHARPSEEEIDARMAKIDQLLEEVEIGRKELRDSLLSYMPLFWHPDTTVLEMPEGDFEYLQKYGDRYCFYQLKKLASIDIQKLQADGYQEMPMTDGSSIYCLQEKNKTCYVDTKTLKFYSMEILDQEQAQALKAWKKAPGEVEFNPINAVLQFFPQHCIAEFSKFTDDCSSFIATINQMIGEGVNMSNTIDALSNLANAILSGESGLRCLYDNGRDKVEEFIRGSFAKQTRKNYAKRQELLKETENLKNDMAKENAYVAQERKNRQEYGKQIAEYEKKISDPNTGHAERDRCMRRKAEYQGKLADVDRNISNANKRLFKMDNRLNHGIPKETQKLEKALAKFNQKLNKVIGQIDKYMPKSLKPLNKLYAKVDGLLSNAPIKVLFQIAPFLNTVLTSEVDIVKWVSLFGSCWAKLPCEAMPEEAQQLVNDCFGFAVKHGLTNGGRIVLDGGNLALSFVPQPPLTLAWWGAKVLDLVSMLYSSWQNKASEGDRSTIEKRLAALKCNPDPDDDDNTNSNGTLNTGSDDDDNNGGGGGGGGLRWTWNFYNLWFVRDPSGYVYEAVSSNRVEGVRASCYYKEQVEDMYGDLYDRVVFWDAENYEQENPLYTDADGRYQWDVPTGWWQVKYEKEGYETTYSEWLPVPPPQLEVNVGITQLRQPQVRSVTAYENAIEVEFDKYMLPDSLNTNNISIVKGGRLLDGEVRLLNAEAGYQQPDRQYASRVAFVPTAPLTFNERVLLTVSRRVESYAGLQMEQDFQQEFTVVNDTLIEVVDTTQVDSTKLTVATPTASRISGTQVNKGATVELSCQTEGATIWYTTDGTCPCDENGSRRKYTAPIVIDRDLTLKAMAEKGVMQPSEVATFEYTVVVDDQTIRTSAAGYATFFSSESAYALPQGLTAQVVTGVTDKRLNYQTIADGNNGTAIPQGVAVLLKATTATSSTYTLTSTRADASYTGENLLHGSDVATQTTADEDSYFYKAAYGPTGTALASWFGWYPANAAKGPFRSEAHRAWLAVPKRLGTRSGYGMDDTSGIEIFETEADDVWHDLQGRRMEQPHAPGIYIKNRKKVVVK